jgi:hypothetical protein
MNTTPRPRPRHELSCLIDDVLGEDAKAALIALRQFGNELDWLEERVITRARADGWSWRPIGRLLNVDHSSLSRRFRHVDRAPRLRPAPEPSWGQADTAAWFRLQRHSRLRAELAAWEQGPFDLVPW